MKQESSFRGTDHENPGTDAADKVPATEAIEAEETEIQLVRRQLQSARECIDALKASEYELRRENHILRIEKERISNLLKVSETERKAIKKRADYLTKKMEHLKKGKVYRILNRCWSIRDKMLGKG